MRRALVNKNIISLSFLFGLAVLIVFAFPALGGPGPGPGPGLVVTSSVSCNANGTANATIFMSSCGGADYNAVHIFDDGPNVYVAQNIPCGQMTTTGYLWDNLSPNTTYNYRILSAETASSISGFESFTTPPNCAPPPPPPTCTPGDTQTQSCTTSESCAGTQLRTCQSNSEWGGFGACSDVPDDGCPAGPPPLPSPGACNNGVDIGLRLYENGVRKIAVEPGSPTSLLRIFKDGIRGIVLVDPSDPNASKMLIQTPSGIKALCLL